MFSRGLQRWRQMAGPSCPHALQACLCHVSWHAIGQTHSHEWAWSHNERPARLYSKQNAWIQQEGRERGQRTIYYRALAPYQHLIPSPRWKEDTCCLKLRVSQVTKLWLPRLPCCWHGKEYPKTTQEWNRWEKATPVEIRQQYYWN